MVDLATLIRKAQQGDKEAFGNIYKLFQSRIYRYAYYNVRNKFQAEDICQETFLKAYKSLDSFKETKGGSFQAYLFRIARNYIIDLSRKKKELPLQLALNQESQIDNEEDLYQKEQREDLQKTLLSLSQKDMEIVILRYFEDLSWYEISKIVDARQGALRVRMGRILNKLKTQLSEI